MRLAGMSRSVEDVDSRVKKVECVEEKRVKEGAGG
jgi:hypothetical protein